MCVKLILLVHIYAIESHTCWLEAREIFPEVYILHFTSHACIFSSNSTSVAQLAPYTRPVTASEMGAGFPMVMWVVALLSPWTTVMLEEKVRLQ
jgi:hypothetical protein